MKINKDKLKKTNGYEEGNAEAVDAQTSEQAIGYKKSVTKNYQSVNSEQIDARIAGAKFFATRKYDGELSIIFFDAGNTVIVNRSGRVRRGIPCVEEAGKLIAAAGVKHAVIPAELYVEESAGRTRIYDVLAALADEKSIGRLRLAAFDIVELDNTPFKAASYPETWNKLNAIFAKGKTCHAVQLTNAETKSDLKKIYDKWVEKEGAEGLVVRCDMPFVYKLKPKYSVDVVVVGFSEGTGEQKGQIRALLLAMIPKEGHYQIVGRTGTGFTDEQRKDLMAKLTPKIIESRYIETDSNHVAFRMIKPDTVVELSVNDIIFETTSGTVTNPILALDKNKYSLFKSAAAGVSFISPVFVRFRDDKKATIDDVRFEYTFVSDQTEAADVEAPKSKLLKREVYKKESGAKIMVQKFLVWKTNKEHLPEYPAYVFYYNNFSSDRKETFQSEVNISDDEKQIMKIMDASIAENVKKGWTKV